MRTERNEQENLKKDEKKNRRKQKIAGGILAIVLVIGGFAAYRISTVKVFPSNAPDGYAILLENGCVRICFNADFKVCGK